MSRQFYRLVLLVTAFLGIVHGSSAIARDLLITAAKPDKLYVIDAKARKIIGDFHISGANNHITTVVPSPDGKIAYVLVNRMESIVGINLWGFKPTLTSWASSRAWYWSMRWPIQIRW